MESPMKKRNQRDFTSEFKREAVRMVDKAKVSPSPFGTLQPVAL